MTSTSKRAYRVIPNVFGMPFGLCGLAILMVLVQLRSIPIYGRAPFRPGLVGVFVLVRGGLHLRP